MASTKSTLASQEDTSEYAPTMQNEIADANASIHTADNTQEALPESMAHWLTQNPERLDSLLNFLQQLSHHCECSSDDSDSGDSNTSDLVSSSDSDSENSDDLNVVDEKLDAIIAHVPIVDTERESNDTAARKDALGNIAYKDANITVRAINIPDSRTINPSQSSPVPSTTQTNAASTPTKIKLVIDLDAANLQLDKSTSAALVNAFLEVACSDSIENAEIVVTTAHADAADNSVHTDTGETTLADAINDYIASKATAHAKSSTTLSSPYNPNLASLTSNAPHLPPTTPPTRDASDKRTEFNNRFYDTLPPSAHAHMLRPLDMLQRAIRALVGQHILTDRMQRLYTMILQQFVMLRCGARVHTRDFGAAAFDQLVQELTALFKEMKPLIQYDLNYAKRVTDRTHWIFTGVDLSNDYLKQMLDVLIATEFARTARDSSLSSDTTSNSANNAQETPHARPVRTENAYLYESPHYTAAWTRTDCMRYRTHYYEPNVLLSDAHLATEDRITRTFVREQFMTKSAPLTFWCAEFDSVCENEFLPSIAQVLFNTYDTKHPNAARTLRNARIAVTAIQCDLTALPGPELLHRLQLPSMALNSVYQWPTDADLAVWNTRHSVSEITKAELETQCSDFVHSITVMKQTRGVLNISDTVSTKLKKLNNAELTRWYHHANAKSQQFARDRYWANRWIVNLIDVHEAAAFRNNAQNSIAAFPYASPHSRKAKCTSLNESIVVYIPCTAMSVYTDVLHESWQLLCEACDRVRHYLIDTLTLRKFIARFVFVWISMNLYQDATELFLNALITGLLTAYQLTVRYTVDFELLMNRAAYSTSFAHFAQQFEAHTCILGHNDANHYHKTARAEYIRATYPDYEFDREWHLEKAEHIVRSATSSEAVVEELAAHL